MFTNKFKLFSISLIAVWVVLLVKNVDIPIYFGTDAQFVGFSKLLTYGNFIALASAIMIVIALLSLHQLNHRLQGSPDTLKNTLTEVSDRSVEYVNVLATVVTLISVILVPTETLRDFIVFLLLMTVISICFMRTNLYYSNPLFAVLGYHIYSDYRLKNIEDNNIQEFFNEEQNEETIQEEVFVEVENKKVDETNYDYIAVLEIPKINLKRGLSQDKYYNNVNRNVEILKGSTMPNISKGNFILAGHSGSGRVAYFRNLNKFNHFFFICRSPT